MSRPIPWNSHWNIHVIRTQMINSVWNHVGLPKVSLNFGKYRCVQHLNRDLKPFYFPVWYISLNIPVSDLPNYFASASIKLLSWLKRAQKPWILGFPYLFSHSIQEHTLALWVETQQLLLFLFFFHIKHIPNDIFRHFGKHVSKRR